MTEGDVAGVIGAETGAAHSDAVTIAFPPREIENVPHDYVFVGVVRAHPIGRMNSFIVKTFQIDRIRAVNSEFARIDKAGHGVDQLEIFVLAKIAERSWKQNQRKPSAISKDEHLEIAAQILRVPFDVAFVHFR